MKGVKACKYNLHRHVAWSNGSTPLNVNTLKNKISLMRKGIYKRGIISLGKQLYEFSFTSLEDVRRVRFSSLWNFVSSYLNLFAWSRDFNPNL